MIHRALLLAIREQLTPADHHTHRRYGFSVPEGCAALHVEVHYSPKRLPEDESHALAQSVLERQASAVSRLVGQAAAQQWTRDFAKYAANVRIPNLLTVSIDDSAGQYRGAGHRQAPDQQLVITSDAASPGLVAGPLPAGGWLLTLTAHSVVSPQCEVSIQIGAEIVSGVP